MLSRGCSIRSPKQNLNYELYNDEIMTNKQKSIWKFEIGVCFVILVSSLVICLSAPLLAQEIPVNIRAEKLKFIEETGAIVASGSVEVKFKEVTIYADFLHMDPVSNLATAEGNVRMIMVDYQATSDFLVYDASSEVTAYKKFSTCLFPKRIKGELYLSAEEITDFKDKMLGKSGMLTTCDYEHPHFITTADKVEYYPDDKVVGYNVVLYVGKMPALWTPYMIYDLSQRRKKNWVFGHNEVEGDYVKSAWDYPFGILYLDLIEKKGYGLGTETPYNLLGLGFGTLFLYHVSEGNAGMSNWVTRIDHTKDINPWTTLRLNHRYTATYLVPSGRKEQTAFGMDLGYKREARWGLKFNLLEDRLGYTKKYSLQFNQAFQKIATDYYLNHELSTQDPKWIRSTQRFSHKRPLFSDRVMLTTRADYYNDIAEAGEPGDERLEPLLELSGKEEAFSWRVTEDWYIDLDRDRFTGDDSYEYLEKLPEVEVSPNPLDLKLFSLQPSFGYGHYHEVKNVSGGLRNYATERYWGTLNASRSIPLGLGTLAILGAGLDQFLYTPGDQRYAYRESLSLRTNLFGFFKNDVDYKKSITDGNTPFIFDQLGTHYHNLQERMTFYYLDKFRWVIEGGRNWQTHKWFDVMTNLTLKPSEGLYWSVRTGWDIENRWYKDLINRLRVSPYRFLSIEFSSTSDMNTGELRSGSLLYDFYILQGEPNQWHVKFSQIYEPATDQFKVRDIMIVKDLHCWEMKYKYSDLRKEFSVTFGLKALPNEPVGISTGRGFYYEGLEKELKEFKREGAVERY